MKLKCLFALKIIIKNTNVSSETFNYTKKFQGKAKKKITPQILHKWAEQKL